MTYLVISAALLVAGAAHADVITQWNFNSATPDGNPATGSTAPSTGAGTASLLPGVTSTFASGSAGAGSSDPVGNVDNSGWNTATYPTQGTGSQTRGTQYLVSTTGFENISLSFDLRFSNTSSRYGTVLYTVNGTDWLSLDPSFLFIASGGDSWLNGTVVDFGNLSDVADNARFGVRIVSTFQPNTNAYAPANPGSTYGTAGTWRFDMVTISGNAIAPIPEPGTYALLLAGLATVGFVARWRVR